MYIVKQFEVVFSLNVKGNNIVSCLHHVRLSYKGKYLPKRESIHANVQSCLYNEKSELPLSKSWIDVSRYKYTTEALVKSKRT